MINILHTYNVFISSPGDVPEERNIVESVIKKIDSICKEVFEISLDVKRWEDLPPITPYLQEQKIQDIIDVEVKKADFFILILNRRYGVIQEGHTISNTEREINTILSKYEKQNRKIAILTYFKRNQVIVNPDEQEQKVVDLKKKLQNIGILYKEFSTPEEFRDLITHAVYSVILKMQTSPYKKGNLRKVWQLGKVDGKPHPEVAIIYPPVHREFMKPLNYTNFWFGRLQPNIYFEDYKGLYKIQKCLSLIGFPYSKIYPDTEMPNNLDSMNRVWVCLPRLPQAIQYLERYSEIARFKFHPRNKNRLGFIEWNIHSKDKITVISPLNQYLKEQRKKMDYQGEWNSQLGKILAKDFAIFARFKDKQNENPDSDGHLQDYYFAGIRGLGTWGATKYIDKHHHNFKNIDEYSDIQILLEVTYSNGRISEIKDVSNENEKYFKNENSLRTIKNRIKTFREREHK